MLKRLLSSSLFKYSGIYTLASIANASLPFILIPYLTRTYTQAEYGTIAMFLLLQTFLVPLVSLNINGAISRKYFSINDKREFSIYIGNALLLLLASTIVISIICFFLRHSLLTVTSLSIKWILISVIVAASQGIFVTVLTLYQVRSKPIFYGILQIAQTALNLLLTILLIENMNLGYEGRLYGIAISYLVFAVISVIIMIYNKDIALRISKIEIKHILKLGVPLIPHTIGGIILGMAGRFMIKNMVSIDEAGVYTVGYQIGSALLLLTSSFNAAYIPWLFNRLKTGGDNDKKTIVKLTYGYFICVTLAGLLIGVVLMWGLPIIVGQRFYSSSIYVPWVLLGFVLNGMYMMIANYIFYAEKTYLLAIGTISVAVLYIPISYFFIKAHGAIGACQASCITYFLLFVVTWFVSNKVVPMPWFKFNRFWKN